MPFSLNVAFLTFSLNILPLHTNSFAYILWEWGYSGHTAQVSDTRALTLTTMLSSSRWTLLKCLQGPRNLLFSRCVVVVLFLSDLGTNPGSYCYSAVYFSFLVLSDMTLIYLKCTSHLFLQSVPQLGIFDVGLDSGCIFGRHTGNSGLSHFGWC